MAKKLQEELKISVISSLSANVIWAALIGFWSLIAANLVSLYHSQSIVTWQYFVAGLSVGATIFASIVAYRERLNKFKPKFPSLSMDYIYKEIEVELYFQSREEITYSANYTVQALKDITGMQRSYFWSSSTISELPVITSAYNHKVVPHKDERESTKTVDIIFEVPLKRNEETSFTVKYTLGDEHKKMLPFLGHFVRNPTEKIVLRLCVPQGMISSVIKSVYADTSATINLAQPAKILPRTIGNNDVYEWKIENASLLYFYQISWEFV